MEAGVRGASESCSRMNDDWQPSDERSDELSQRVLAVRPT